MPRFDQNQTVLAGIPQATLQQYLTQAQTAYNALMTGQREVTVSYEGKSVSYTSANRGDLEGYIALLLRALGLSRGRRALRPYFR